MGQIQSLDELIGLLIRRRLLIGAVTVFGMVMTLLYVIAKPDVFEAAAVIQVQTPTVADPTAPGTQAAGQSAQRLQAIEQRLTTRENMLAVIERHGLFTGLPLSDDEKVHLLRMSLRFQTVASAATPAFGAPPQVSAMIIFAQAETREKAARVANDFAQSILDAGVEGQTGRAREAVVFFTDQEQKLRAEIQRVEAEMAAFQTANANALPAQRDLRRTEIAGLEVDLRALDQALVAAGNERAAIERKETLRATDRRQLETLSAQMETLTAQRTALVAQRDAADTALARTPDIERALSDFDRNLDQLQSRFEVATSRLAEADTAQRLEETRQGETFALLERAVEPDYPISGGRKKLAIVGSFASLMLGVGLAFLLDLLHPVLRTSAQLERQLDLRPIVAIPQITGIGAVRRRPLIAPLTGTPGENGQLSKLPGGHSGQASAAQKIALPLPVSLAGGAAVVFLVMVAAALT